MRGKTSGKEAGPELQDTLFRTSAPK